MTFRLRPTIGVVVLALVAATRALAAPSPGPLVDVGPLPEPSPGQADEEGGAASEARAHYRAGQRLYADGHYEEAIVEFQTAYEKRPHPNVLYNIGQASERLLDYRQSVLWFERYLREAPADAALRTTVENRLHVLRSLPARISVNTIPEDAHVVIRGPGGVFTATAPTVQKVPAGDYQVELSADGWESESHAVHADLGNPYFYQYPLKRSMTTLQLFTRPRGARVFIDERLVGETPYADRVEVGRHQLLIEHPDYPWHRELLDLRSGAPLRREIKLARPGRSGRTELVIASMAYGAAVGPLVVGAISDFQGAGRNLGVLLGTAAAGIGLGFVGSFLGANETLKVGHSSTMIGAGAYGALFGGGLGLALPVQDRWVYGLTLIGSAVGIASGYLVARYTDASPGDAAVFNSGGLWGTASGLLLAQSISVSPSRTLLGALGAGGSALGMALGTLAAWRVEVSRSHVALIDLGGLGGGGLGLLIGYVVGANQKGASGIQTGARFGLGGLALGIVTAAVLSRNYKDDLPPLDALLRTRHFALQQPSLRFEQPLATEGGGQRVVLDVLRGRF